jgi:hypothetical protein
MTGSTKHPFCGESLGFLDRAASPWYNFFAQMGRQFVIHPVYKQN